MIVLNKMYMNGDIPHQNETLIKLAEKISIEIDSSDTKKIRIGKVPTLISWSSVFKQCLDHWSPSLFTLGKTKLSLLKKKALF